VQRLLFEVFQRDALYKSYKLLLADCRIIHEHGYTPEECLTYRPVVYSNVTQSLVAIVRAAGQLNIEFEHPDRAVRPTLPRSSVMPCAHLLSSRTVVQAEDFEFRDHRLISSKTKGTTP